jgi:dTDP-4-amino-4,6-dideoxygalactose transaminase
MKPYYGSSASGMPAWAEIRLAIEGIFERRYYTENGPIVQALEQSLREQTGLDQVVCVSNGFVAALMLLNTLPQKGEALIVGGTLSWLDAAIAWFPGLVPVRCHSEEITSALTSITSVIIVQERNVAAAIKQVCTDNLRPDILVVFDTTASPLDGPSGADVHLCRMREMDPLNAVDGAFIATAHSDIADELRSMRSSSGVTRKMQVNKTVNGRLSEAHAAIGLISLGHIAEVTSNQ